MQSIRNFAQKSPIISSVKVVAFLAFASFSSFAQNLVPNSGLEYFFACPGSYNYSTTGKVAPGWFSPTTGTPDLFNQCSKGEAGVPANWAGVSKTVGGKGYAGIFVYVIPNKNYREYLQAELVQPLEKGGEYYVEFYFKLSSFSKYSIDRIGFLLSDSAYRTAGDRPFPIRPTYELVMSKPYNRTTGLWNKCAFTHISTGGEKFLTIGNFSTDEKTRSFNLTFSKAKEPMLSKAAYFYIDEVKIIRLDEPKPQKPPVVTGYKEIEVNKTYVLKNIFFDFDSYELMENSFSELNEWLQVIKFRSKWKVELTGHTDERGTDEYNLKLSKQRVESVAAYLIKMGIDGNRITTKGEGKSKPLSLGKDEAAHAINRRVEIRFSEK